MYENSGQTIKKIGIAYAALGMLASLIWGISLIADYVGELGWPILIGGLLSFFVTGIFICGFGELVENSACTAYQSKLVAKKLEEIKESLVAQTPEQKEQSVKNSLTQNSQPANGSSKQVSYIDATKNISVEVCKDEDGKITCPICNTKQAANRSVCWKCGQKFITT